MASTAVNDRDPSRAHWMELFFDLIFVALVAQLAHPLHEHPSFDSLILFVVLFAAVWWSWVNLTFTVNTMPSLTRRQLAAVMLAAMVAVGGIAVSAPEATSDRAWLFAGSNAALRIVLLTLWVTQSWNGGPGARVRLLAYNGITALLWGTSIWLPPPWSFGLWGICIVLEVTLLVTSSNSWAERILPRMNTEHLSERFGLLVVIVFGESVLSIVMGLNGSFAPSSGIVALLGLAALSTLAWSFFMFAIDAMHTGLERLRGAGRYHSIRDAVAFLPFLIVVGVTAISGALDIAIQQPEQPLPEPSTVALCGGIAMFFAANALIALRFQRAIRQVLAWAIPALLLTLVLGIAGTMLPAAATIAGAVVALLVIVITAEVRNRQQTPTITAQTELKRTDQTTHQTQLPERKA